MTRLLRVVLAIFIMDLALFRVPVGAAKSERNCDVKETLKVEMM